MYAGNGQLLQPDKKQLLYKHFKKLVVGTATPSDFENKH
jgi:5-keto 4-deoxyuronate isomerase